jgi:hypothetical protein
MVAGREGRKGWEGGGGGGKVGRTGFVLPTASISAAVSEDRTSRDETRSANSFSHANW